MEFIRPKKPGLSLDMAPLIDIVFQLLIFFMLSSSFLTPSLKLNLPKAVTADDKETERIVISLDRDGKVFINTQPSSLSSLKQQLAPMLAADSKRAVHIRGDEEMPYRVFVQAMDAARMAGAKQVNIVHSPEEAA